jgi:hypothetical protein
MKTISQNDQKWAFKLLNDLVTFAKEQDARGLVDGACDPTLSVEAAEALLAKYASHVAKKDDQNATALAA